MLFVFQYLEYNFWKGCVELTNLECDKSLKDLSYLLIILKL